MLSEDRREQLATFLKVRRARLQPEAVGLPRIGRRRTAGLRRGEVAALAGISTEWYTRLEQARGVRPSAQVLQRIATALRLQPDETQHLLVLAGYGARENGQVSTTPLAEPSPQLRRLIEQHEHGPAWAFADRGDILAWNRATTMFFGDLAAMHGLERNAYYHTFLNEPYRRMVVDWDVTARDCLAKLRLVHARNVDDPSFNELIDLLRTRSPEFDRWWNEHLVLLPQDGLKMYDHPAVGRLTFDFTQLDVASDPRGTLHVIFHVPANGTDTRDKMAQLLRGAGVGTNGSGPATQPVLRVTGSAAGVAVR